MLKECLEVFKELYKARGDKYITDNYHLSEGYYVSVKEDGKYDIYDVPKKDADTTNDNYKHFSELDYLSKLIDMNKPIDKKKIVHSNNYYSFFIKKENVTTQKLIQEKIIDNYFDMLLDPAAKYDKEKKDIYIGIEKKYGKANELLVEKHRNWIKENIFDIAKPIKKDKVYIKVFFEEDIEEYKKESEKYIVPNIYNSNQYNIKINGETYGLPNDNMGLNSKKPYLENKTRKNTLPYLISDEGVILQKKFFDLLMNFANEGRTNIYIGCGDIRAFANDEGINDEFNGYFLKINKGKEVEILDFDNITHLNNRIDGLKVAPVIPINYGNNEPTLLYGPITNIGKLKSQVNAVFYSKFLINNMFTDPKDINLFDSQIKQNLILYRNGYFNWFYKGNDQLIKQYFSKASLDIIKNSINCNRMITAREQYNLRAAIIKYFGGENNMADFICSIADGLRDKISGKRTGSIETDKEFYFAMGQLASYLISQNRSSKKMHSLINPILNCKTEEKIKKEIEKLFKKYGYAIQRDHKKFNNLYAMIIGYEADEDIDNEMIIAGYLYSNLLYESNKEEENRNGN